MVGLENVCVALTVGHSWRCFEMQDMNLLVVVLSGLGRLEYVQLTEPLFAGPY